MKATTQRHHHCTSTLYESAFMHTYPALIHIVCNVVSSAQASTQWISMFFGFKMILLVAFYCKRDAIVRPKQNNSETELMLATTTCDRQNYSECRIV